MSVEEKVREVEERKRLWLVGREREETSQSYPPHSSSRTHERDAAEMIDRLALRLADRLGGEGGEEEKEKEKAEDESATVHSSALYSEFESHKCPICLEFMIPPRSPFLLFPCGHSFWYVPLQSGVLFSDLPLSEQCLTSYTRLGRRTCPSCRKRIQSQALNYSLQQLIESYVSTTEKEKVEKQKKIATKKTMNVKHENPSSNPLRDMLLPYVKEGDIDTAEKYAKLLRRATIRKEVLEDERKELVAGMWRREARKKQIESEKDSRVAEKTALLEEIRNLELRLRELQELDVEGDMELEELDVDHEEEEGKMNFIDRILGEMSVEIEKSKIFVENLAPGFNVKLLEED